MLLVLNLMLRLWGAIARDRRDLVLENIALRHQVAVLTRTKRRPGAAIRRPPALDIAVGE